MALILFGSKIDRGVGWWEENQMRLRLGDLIEKVVDVI